MLHIKHKELVESLDKVSNCAVLFPTASTLKPLQKGFLLDPIIKIPEESDFYELEPLDQVAYTDRKWYKCLPKQ